MNENVALIDPGIHCVHNNMALCALTFKIVVLAWNRSNHQQAKEIESFVVSDFFLHDEHGSLLRPNSLRRLFLSLDRTDFAFEKNNPGWQVCCEPLSLSFPPALSLTFERCCFAG